MIFKDSCVTGLSEYACTEESTVIPTDIFPLYLGSGNTVMSVDASGLQSFSHGVQKAFGAMPGSGDMYVVSHGMISDHIDKMNVLPYGYLEWDAQFPGTGITGRNLKEIASVWKRTLDIKEGRIVTKMLLGIFAELSIELVMPLGHDCIIIIVKYKGYDYSNQPIKDPVKGEMGIWLNLRTRSGKPVYDNAALNNDTLSVSVSGHEQYEYEITFTGDCQRKPDFRDGRFGIRFDVEAADTESEYRFMIDFSEGLNISGHERLLEENVIRRTDRFSSSAVISGIDSVETFLYNNTLYLLMSCFDFTKGLPIGMPFFFPWCWRCSTFWDSHFVMDGLMRSGWREQSDVFVRYIHSKMNSTGKPFPWMFAYDGTATVEDDRDIAPLVMCAHAMTAIKHYEYFNDFEFLKKYDYEICRNVSIFASRNLFGKDEQGRWIMMMPVSGDVVEDAPSEINQTFTALWFLVIFSKTVEMQEILGLEKDSLLCDILNGFYLEHTENEYLSARDLSAREQAGASWVPFLLYPTEGMPFVDMKLMNKTRDKYNFPDLYMEKQGSYQPWTEFIQASSDFRRGAIEEGFRMRQIGLSHAFGAGLFSEIGPKQQTAGLPPYISAHGSFLTALFSQFIQADIWNGPVCVFTQMPLAYRYSALSVRGIVCQKGFVLSAEYRPDSISVEIVNKHGKDIIVEIAKPFVLNEEEIHVVIDSDKEAGYKYEYDKAGGNFRIEFTTVKNAVIKLS